VEPRPAQRLTGQGQALRLDDEIDVDAAEDDQRHRTRDRPERRCACVSIGSHRRQREANRDGKATAARASDRADFLRPLTVWAIDVPTRFRDFDDYWTPFLGGQAPAPGYAMSLTDAKRAELRDRIRERLPVSEDGSIDLIARAWAVKGIVPSV